MLKLLCFWNLAIVSAYNESPHLTPEKKDLSVCSRKLTELILSAIQHSQNPSELTYT